MRKYKYDFMPTIMNENYAFLILFSLAFLFFTCKAQKEGNNTSNQGLPNIPTCHDTNDPQTVDWLKTALEKHQPDRITKYVFRTNGWAYWFEGNSLYLYDCQGGLICESRLQEAKDCLQFVENRNEGVIIWENEGIKD